MAQGKRHSALITLTFLMSGCAITPMRDMTTPVDINAPYLAQNETSEMQKTDHWWTLYNDDDLNTLMAHAFANNPDINIIRARLAQAQAQSRKTASTLFPSISATAERETSRGDTSNGSDYALSGAASFELDLWGGNHADLNASQLEAQASAQDIHTAAITLSANVVKNWLTILSLMEQEALIRKQIEVNRTILSLQQKRFEMGSSSALDILQQEETLARSEGLLPDTLSAQKQAINNIALLIGEVPQNGIKINATPFPHALPIPNAGLPSDLLANRPDIIAAWLRLRAADWAEQAAWANRLPSFNLSATYATSAAQIGGLFNAWLLNLAAAVTAPVFDGGNRKAEQFRQKAIADERFQNYRAAVLTAVNDVENALVENTYQDQKLTALEKQLNASRQTLEQAQVSYQNGQKDYLNVLNSLTNSQALEQQILAETLSQAIARVDLYRVLGGKSWAQTLMTEGKE